MTENNGNAVEVTGDMPAPFYKAPTEEEITAQMQGHDSGTAPYTLLADKLQLRRGGAEYKLGDTVNLSVADAHRLLASRAVAAPDDDAARRARLKAATLSGDEESKRELKVETIEARIRALEAERQRLEKEGEEQDKL